MAKIFSGYNLLLQIILILITWLLVSTDLDWTYFLEWNESPVRAYVWPAIALGGVLPILVPLVLFLFKKTKILGFALGQAAILGFTISSLYKAFTGRIPPTMNKITNGLSDVGGQIAQSFGHGSKQFIEKSVSLIDTSHGFQFGFLRGGVFWGWPSSHTTVAFAMAFALVTLYPRHKWLTWPAIIFALYVGFGVSISIHWLSEFVAGAILGAVIGTVVGKSFKNFSEKLIKK